MHSLTFLFGAAVSAAITVAVQDPTKPAPPPTPAAPAAAAAKEQPGRPPRAPLEGVYELRRRVVGGQNEVKPSRGYLAITSRHLFLCVAGPGGDPDVPLLRAGVHEWRVDGERVRSVVKLSYYNDMDGDIHVDPPGTVEVRRIVLEQGGVRVVQDERNWLEFVRLE